MVKKNSININQSEVNFVITDFKNELIVNYKGSIPNLFEEEKELSLRDFFKTEIILRRSKFWQSMMKTICHQR